MSSKDYFEEVAPEWDNMRQTFFSEGVREKAFTLAKIQPETLVADIGAGTGFITEGLLAHGAKVIAIDQSAAMLDELSKKLNHHPNVDCLLGDSDHLPVSDNIVDYVFANMYLHHVESPLKAIQEMARILKPGGKLIITDLDEHSFGFLKEEHQDRWMGFERDKIRQWFDLSGLKDIQIDCISENCCAASCTGDTKASISIFAASGVKR
ncbi:MAG: Methyltransferase [Clostridia bacterium]|jgi:ubiquinone/menaquinone biosynthesis C-methylase UbiE|nr:Methyltransferase [Clostridia bacterium]